MQTYSFRQAPFRVFGVPFFEKTGVLERLPQALAAQLDSDQMPFLAQRCPGARLCFRTDSPVVGVKITLAALTPDIGMSIYSCQSANVFFGPRPTARYAGLARPEGYDGAPCCQGTFQKSAEMEDVTIFLPRNEQVEDMVIQLADGAQLAPPTPYRFEKPLVFYGSSITEGGCCSKPANAYNAMLSRWLDADYYNLGFSGAARGELPMADYINTIDQSVFVMDYDHNAPDAAHLQRTHEPFFRRVRAAQPTLPIVLMTKPDFDFWPDSAQRRDIIRATYDHARAAGDENVYFVDGRQFFGEDDRAACTNDCVHPNDLGMYRMAKVLLPVIQRLLVKNG